MRPGLVQRAWSCVGSVKAAGQNCGSCGKTLKSNPRHAHSPMVALRDLLQQEGEAVKIPFFLIQMGDMPSLGSRRSSIHIGVKSRTASPFPHTIVVTMVYGSAKYLPDTTNYDRKTPEARSTRFARGSAENAATQIIEALKQMHEDSFK